MRYLIPDFNVDLSRGLFLIAGPCVIESRDHVLFMASELKKITSARGVPFSPPGGAALTDPCERDSSSLPSPSPRLRSWPRRRLPPSRRR